MYSAWDEIHDVFGDGHEYDWALVGEDELDHEEDISSKPEMRYQDVRALLVCQSPDVNILSRSLNPQKFASGC